MLGVRLGNLHRSTFANGEIYVRPIDSVRGADCFVMQSHSLPINENIMEQFITIDALRRASARRITAVMPFYGYSRQDKKVLPREPITARLVGDHFLDRRGRSAGLGRSPLGPAPRVCSSLRPPHGLADHHRLPARAHRRPDRGHFARCRRCEAGGEVRPAARCHSGLRLQAARTRPPQRLRRSRGVRRGRRAPRHHRRRHDRHRRDGYQCRRTGP